MCIMHIIGKIRSQPGQLVQKLVSERSGLLCGGGGGSGDILPQENFEI